MKEFVEKLIGRLEEEIIYDTFDHYKEEALINMSFEKLEDIINELAEEYSADTPQKSANGWIPCSERLPEIGKRYLVSCIVKTGDIEEYTVWHAIYAGSRGWYADNGKPLNAEIIAWQYLPEPYKPQKEAEWKDKVMKHFTKTE